MIDVFDDGKLIIVQSKHECKCGNRTWIVDSSHLYLCSKCDIMVYGDYNRLKTHINKDIRERILKYEREQLIKEYCFASEQRRIEIMAEVLGSHTNI